MANPMVAKYTKQMSAMLLPETGGWIGAWAETRGVPISQVMRELVEAGAKVKRKEWAREYGALDENLLETHVERCTRQGGKQLSRRRDYDENRRGKVDRAGDDEA